MKKREIVIVFAIIALALSSHLLKPKRSNGMIVVYYHKKVLKKIAPEASGTYTFHGDKGVFHLQVKKGRYRAIDVDCPNQICVHTSWVKAGEEKSIICAPNAISVVYEN